MGLKRKKYLVETEQKKNFAGEGKGSAPPLHLSLVTERFWQQTEISRKWGWRLKASALPAPGTLGAAAVSSLGRVVIESRMGILQGATTGRRRRPRGRRVGCVV